MIGTDHDCFWIFCYVMLLFFEILQLWGIFQILMLPPQDLIRISKTPVTKGGCDLWTFCMSGKLRDPPSSQKWSMILQYMRCDTCVLQAARKNIHCKVYNMHRSIVFIPTTCITVSITSYCPCLLVCLATSFLERRAIRLERLILSKLFFQNNAWKHLEQQIILLKYGTWWNKYKVTGWILRYFFIFRHAKEIGSLKETVISLRGTVDSFQKQEETTAKFVCFVELILYDSMPFLNKFDVFFF